MIIAVTVRHSLCSARQLGTSGFCERVRPRRPVAVRHTPLSADKATLLESRSANPSTAMTVVLSSTVFSAPAATSNR
jgi:hypothetical protein